MNFETWWKEVGREWAERQFDGKGLIAPPCLNLMEEAKTLASKVWETAYAAGCVSVVEAFTPVRTEQYKRKNIVPMPRTF